MKPLLEFESDNPDFAMGFECGRVWALLKHAPDELLGQPFHASNAEMVLRMIEASGVGMLAEFSDDPNWMFLVTT